MILVYALIGVAAAVCALALVAICALCRRNAHIWLPAYILRRRPRPAARPVHVLFCVADHYEPDWRGGAMDGEERIRVWLERYPAMAQGFADADGRPPRHTFFFPIDHYRPEYLDALGGLCRAGYGEVEVHLHHRDDTPEALRERLLGFRERLRQHGLLTVEKATGEGRYGFIHGNWALDNSRPDGRWCGVNNELQVLRETGCYADFTLPSAPSPTQTRKVNSLYYAADDPARPKSHDWGVDAAVGRAASGDLLIVQGPLGLNWRARKLGLLPGIENAALTGANPGSPHRVALWVRQGIHVLGRSEWVFVKVHCHGAREDGFEALLGEGARRMHACLAERYNDGREYALHYVTARELVNVIKAAEAGLSGSPNDFRDYLLTKPCG